MRTASLLLFNVFLCCRVFGFSAEYVGAAISMDCETRMEDAYKWIYQATMGAEHAVSDVDKAKIRLESEWHALDMTAFGADESLLTPLDPDSTVVRLHLRPYRQAGGNTEALFTAFIESAAEFHGELSQFIGAWKAFGLWVATHSSHLDAKAWKQVDARQSALNYPPIRHSDHYRTVRSPAYRVLSGTQADALLQRLDNQTGTAP